MTDTPVLDPAGETPPIGDPAYVLDEQVGFILRQVQQRHTVIFASAFGEELTPMQWAALARLTEAGECSQNQLGRLIATDVATIKGVVDRLVRRGLVATAPDGSDRRRVVLRLTDEGREAYRKRESLALAVSADTLRPLSPDERATFLALLDRLR